MDTDALTTSALQELRSARPYPAVSLTMPTHRREPEAAQDAVRLRNLVGRAAERLEADPEVTRQARTAVKEQLDRAVTDLDPRRALDGLVILASADEHQVWRLPRTLPERVVVSDTYLTRNLVAAKAQARPYWAVTVSAEHATLWSGTGEALREARTGGFPLTARREEFDAQREERVGDTPSTFQDEQTRQFLRSVDEALRAVLTTESRPLYLLGLAPALALLEEVGESARSSAGRVSKGVPADISPTELLKELTPALEGQRLNTAENVEKRLDEALGRRDFAGGLDEVWSAVQDHRARLVAVEEHYQRTVRLTDGHLTPVPDGATEGASPDEVREDIIDELVEAALDSGADVVFLPDDALAEHDRIAAALRY